MSEDSFDIVGMRSGGTSVAGFRGASTENREVTLLLEA
jgi:hypothetical protein